MASLRTRGSLHSEFPFFSSLTLLEKKLGNVEHFNILINISKKENYLDKVH